MRAMLEVVLQNLRSQSWVHRRTFSFQRSDDFASADYLRCRQACNFRRQHQINLELDILGNHLLGAKQQARTADVLGCTGAPSFLAKRTILQRQLKLEPLRAEWR